EAVILEASDLVHAAKAEVATSRAQGRQEGLQAALEALDDIVLYDGGVDDTASGMGLFRAESKERIRALMVTSPSAQEEGKPDA
ncbi:MAG: hypothetical protein KGR26_11800, partial [Cyanobacteria bacterium REEB65]|nr:hypothetical protein [Cyanobacteria bacterium REEB65]